jgi:NADH-quinone oxidoreductase subunit L
MFMTFYGEPRGDHHAHDHAHESPRTMLIPLAVLAAGSILAGMIWYKPFFGDHNAMNAFFGIPVHAEAGAVEPEAVEIPAAEVSEAEHAAGPAAEGHAEAGPAVLPGEGAIYFGPDNHVIDNAHHVPAWVKVSPFVAMAIGLALAYWFYIFDPSRTRALAELQPVLYRFLLNKWYFDELYELIFVRPAVWLGSFLWKKGDGATIDGAINGVAMGIVPWVTRLAGRAQSGYLFHYAFAMVLGLVAITLWLGLGLGGGQ